MHNLRLILFSVFFTLLLACNYNTGGDKDTIYVDSTEISANFTMPDTAALRRNFPVVRLETNLGNMEFALYNFTTEHSKNFLKLVKSGFYDGVLFHRVIQGFIAQGGDPNSKNPNYTDTLGKGELPYMLTGEISDTLHHFRGALAAAQPRQLFQTTYKTSACQFFIVFGKKFAKQDFASNEQLNRDYFFASKEGKKVYAELVKAAQAKDLATQNKLMELAKERGKALVQEKYMNYSLKAKSLYANWGGAPLLDGEYTVFGQCISGFEVLDKIQQVPAQQPLFVPSEKIVVRKALVVKE